MRTSQVYKVCTSKVKKEKLKLRHWMINYFAKNVQVKEIFFRVNAKGNVVASKISLSKDLIDVKARQ